VIDLIPQMADFALSFEGIEWAFVSGVYESDTSSPYAMSGTFRAAAVSLKEASAISGRLVAHCDDGESDHSRCTVHRRI
jgi:hypothetical protein